MRWLDGRKGLIVVLVLVGLSVSVLAPRFTGSTGAVAQTAPPDAAAAVPTLTLSLSTTLDTGVSGAVKATSITSADLLNTAGTVVKTATIAAGAAKFNMTGLTAGDYFIRVNGLANDLVPTRIVSATTSFKQYVGQKLRQSVIGSLTAPSFRILTWSKGQAQKAVVAYSNGVVVSPKAYSYGVQALKAPQSFQVRVLGKGALLGRGGPGEHTWSTWMIGPKNHGKGSMASCSACHGTLTKKPAAYASISQSNGWCYQCHYGPTGPAAGNVNPTK